MKASNQIEPRQRSGLPMLGGQRAPRAERRGILLLVVLSLLVLFLLVGTAFITSSDDYRKSSKVLARPFQPAESPLQREDLLDEALGQLVRDTANPHSSIRHHSLLADLYGNDGLLIGPTSQQFLRFVDPSGAPSFNFDSSSISFDPDDFFNNTGNQFFWAAIAFDPNNPFISKQEDYYNGRIFTLLDGPAAGRSARVMRYFVDANTGSQALFYLMFTDGGPNLSATELNIQESQYAVLNGQPFNGTGVGYNINTNPNNPTDPWLDAEESVRNSSGGSDNRTVALMPDARFFDPNRIVDPTPFDYGVNWPGPGGSDESYDAIDFQNMALAFMPVLPEEQNTGNAATIGSLTIPSFHRPALLHYWRDQFSGLDSDGNLLRRVLLRPNWIDHPNFTGSNPDYARRRTDPTDPAAASLGVMINGPWDVDNDNDGRRDSMWIDIGLPVMPGPQGKLVKPLAAIMCVDLDGRLNINAHGSFQLAGFKTNDNSQSDPVGQPIAGGIGRTTALLPEGQGYGPAEIDLQAVFDGQLDNSLGASDSLYLRLLQGATPANNNDERGQPFDRLIPGRYGLRTTDLEPGNPVSYDLLAQLKQQGLPQRLAATSTSSDPNQWLGNYATPPDLFGRYALGLNDLGQPVYEAAFDPIDLDINSPYELNLSRLGAVTAGPNALDGPFSVGEFERIFRAYDEDSGKLPNRLWNLANKFQINSPNSFSRDEFSELQQWRTLLTTDSFEVPVPSVTLPKWMILGLDRTASTPDDFVNVMGRTTNLTFRDLLEYRVRLGLGLGDPIVARMPANRLRIQQVMRQLLAPELASGQRLDINRPFGNGRDDNNNRVVDEPGEFADLNANGEFDPNTGEQLYWDRFDRVTDLPNAAATFSVDKSGDYRDAIDRDGDGIFEPAELGYLQTVGGFDPNTRMTMGDPLTQSELVKLHNFRRQWFARHMYVLAMTLVDPVPNPSGNPTDPNFVANSAERARRLAQWSINVADFRDPDNISTAFEYDANPFNGWGADPNNTIDGLLATTVDVFGTDNKVGGTGVAADVGGVVWGAERPELLITETLAWHDRRTFDSQRESVNSEDEPEDVNFGSNGGIGDVQSGVDMTQDQEFRPQGAAFIELYNPWPAETAANEDTHRVDTNGNDLGVNLSAVANGSPVWRMLVFSDGGNNRSPDSHNEDLLPDNLPDLYADTKLWTDERYRSVMKNKRVQKNLADRSIYFTNFDPGDPSFNAQWDKNDGVGFFSSLNVPSVRPGRFMVVAGVDTLDPDQQGAGAGEYLVKFGRSGSRGIRLNINETTDPNAGVALLGNDGQVVTDQAGFTVKSPAEGTVASVPSIPGFNSMTSVAIINRARPNSSYLQPERRFTFSEPAGGYPDRVPLHNKQSLTRAFSGFHRGTRAYRPVMDRPLDERRVFPGTDPGGGSTVISPTTLNDGELRLALPDDVKGGALRTIPAFSWVYLQRLRNPTIPWNPEHYDATGKEVSEHDPNMEVNPYMTIDSMAVNLTVFNGESEIEYFYPPGMVRESGSGVPQPPKGYSNNNAVTTFASLQRGRLNIEDPNSVFGDYAGAENFAVRIQNFVKRGLTVPRQFLRNPDPNDPANEPIIENLWAPEQVRLWRNKAGMAADGTSTGPSHRFPGTPDCTLGFLNEQYRDPSTNNKLVPAHAFPWMTWNNRSYVGEGELLQVPAFATWELPRAFASERSASVFERYTGRTIRPGKDGLKLDAPFSHLMNFFRTEISTADPNNRGIAGLYRILDYVGTPSRYVGTETWLNPTNFGSSDPNSSYDPRYLRQPPFNRVSNYRNPGLVNLNTITNARVWDGGILQRELLDPTSEFDPFTNNYDPNSGHAGPLFVDPVLTDLPTLTTSRRGYPAVSRDPVWLLNNQYPTFFANPFRAASASDLVPIAALLRSKEIEGTLLRSRGDAGKVPQDVPVFYQERESLDSTNPNFSVANAAIDTSRNPYFRYQAISRLQNLTSNHSNVYAVWITIGFFEVEEPPTYDANTYGTPAVYNRVYPEGYAFGREFGIDTGEDKRLRLFAIVDRSVPVAFEPGHDHNVERAIRLRRRIE